MKKNWYNKKATRKYAVKPGAHLRKDEAQIVGEAIEDLRRQLRRTDFTAGELERYCRAQRRPIHPIWARVRDSIASSAGREAAAYLMRSIVMIPYGETSAESAPRMVVVLGPPQPGRTTSRPAEDIAPNVDLILEYTGQFETTLRGHMQEFTHVVGVGRMKEAVLRVLEEFPIKKTNAA